MTQELTFEDRNGDGNVLKAIMQEKKQLTVIQSDKEVLTITVQEVYYIPGLHLQPFSRASLKNIGLCLVLSKNNVNIVFDQTIQRLTGHLLGVNTEKKTKTPFATMEGKSIIELNQLHRELGHPNHSHTLKTAWRIVNLQGMCCLQKRKM